MPTCTDCQNNFNGLCLLTDAEVRDADTCEFHTPPLPLLERLRAMCPDSNWSAVAALYPDTGAK